MSDIVISVENLSKRYTIDHHIGGGDGLRHAIHDLATAPLRWVRGFGSSVLGIGNPNGNCALTPNTQHLARNPQHLTPNTQHPIPGVEEFWALRGVSFEVKRGEVVGIIGRNGAGKSTLLKILSRITDPTEGRVRIRGRVASLLEVGTGFHPELTGRENIFVNGAILGMSKQEIKSKFDEIVDFAEIERFLDTPVKRYSSGMYVRLAFAVAAHLEPEILIVDEVLAVGDVVFQKKCIGKMQHVAQGGRTVLFVSHNMQTVTGLTDHAVLLQVGRIAAIGESAGVVEQYLGVEESGDGVYEQRGGGVCPEITRVQLQTSGPGTLQQFGKAMRIDIEVTTPHPIPNAAISFQICTPDCQPVLHVLNLDQEVAMLRSAGVHRLSCHFPKLRLYPGHYHLTFYFGASSPRRTFEAPAQVCPFEVAVLDETRDFYWYPDNALYVEDIEWTAEELDLSNGAVA